MLELIRERRRPQLERLLVDWLRAQPEGDRLTFILAWLSPGNRGEPSYWVGFVLARKCLHTRPIVKEFFLQGIERADASEIRWWLPIAIDKLGRRRVLRLLKDLNETNPEGVERAHYWMSRMKREQG